MEELFEPSAQPNESEWFALNENGQRERPMSAEEVAEVKKLLEDDLAAAAQRREELESVESTPGIELTGGFLPIETSEVLQPVSDQLAS